MQGINCGIAFTNCKMVSLNNKKLNPKELEGDLNLNPPKNATHCNPNPYLHP
jgi:hypothetical protein